MIAIVDYDAGNLKSVEKALESLGAQTVITRDPETILCADKVILPGVGAFGDAMEKLHQYGLVEVLHEVVKRQIPFLGICLGLQLLFDSSEESPGVKGLGICKGRIVRIPDHAGLKVPHMGWNSLTYGDRVPGGASAEKRIENRAGNTEEDTIDNKAGNTEEKRIVDRPGRLFAGIPEGSYVYFVHSYYLKAEDPAIVAASTEYATHIHASIEQGNVFACQFHPEKSGKTGLAILKNFIEIGKEEV